MVDRRKRKNRPRRRSKGGRVWIIVPDTLQPTTGPNGERLYDAQRIISVRRTEVEAHATAAQARAWHSPQSVSVVEAVVDGSGWYREVSRVD